VFVVGGSAPTVKPEWPMGLPCAATRTPATSREAPAFRRYHNAIWEQLDSTLPAPE